MPTSELIGVAALAHRDLVVDIVAVAACRTNQARDSHQHILTPRAVASMRLHVVPRGARKGK